MDSVREQQHVSCEVNEAISSSSNNGIDIDELVNELNKLEDQAALMSSIARPSTETHLSVQEVRQEQRGIELLKFPLFMYYNTYL